MARCNWRGCEGCFPPQQEERNAIESAHEAVGYRIYKTTSVFDDFFYLGENWAETPGSVYFSVPCELENHPDRYEPWFQALALAYEAGLRRAQEILKEEYHRHGGDPEDLK